MWNLIHAEVQGRSHIATGCPCQDKTYSLNSNNVYALALADGAGSAKYSHYGAQETVKCICEEMVSFFDNYYQTDDAFMLKALIINLIKSKLQILMDEHNCTLNDLASTLLFAAIKGDTFILGHLGDGVIGYTKNGEIKVASSPENGEFANTTIFTTSIGAEKSIRLIKGKLNGIRGFILMSDGPESCLYSKRENKISKAALGMMERCIHTESSAVRDFLFTGLKTQIRKKTIDDCSIAFLFDDRDEFLSYKSLSKKEKIELLKLKRETSNRVFNHYETLFENSEFSINLKDVSKKIHVKPKYARKYVSRLCELGFFYIKEHKYVRAIKY